jgi:two-component system cell cycle sensor histidine kinase/response regulator CckA
VIKGVLQPGSYVILSIKDTGTGISEQNLLRIFDPFFSTKDPGQGTGLGLSNALQVMQDFHGGLRVETLPPKGTTFFLYFPCCAGQTIKTENVPTRKPNEGPSFMRILLVEDEDPIRMFTSRALREKGYEVLESSDGIQAMQILHANPNIHLVVTDVMMPGIDGPALAAAVKELNPSIRILFVSGYPEDEVRAQLGKSLGKVYFLQKPFALADFVSQIQRLFCEPPSKKT